MPEHHFDVDLAIRYGVLEAVIINHFQFWIRQNEANNRNFYDGRYWTFNSARAFSKIFPYVSERKIRIALKHLQDENIIMTGNYNKSSYDRTLWYAFTDYATSILQNRQMEVPEMSNQTDRIDTPIPDNNTNNNTFNNTDKNTARKRATPARESFGEYGWVKLTEEEHNRLVSEYGLSEVQRAIAYIDESAQSTGNKNKWKDWNLVVRKCIRDGWGKRQQQQQSTGGSFKDVFGDW